MTPGVRNARRARTSVESVAYVLRFSEWSETSRIVHLITPAHGRIPVVARGVERPSSPWRGVFDQLHRVRIRVEFDPERELQNLREARLEDHHPGLRRGLDRWYAALYAAELCDAAAQPGPSSPELFGAFARALEMWSAPESVVATVLLRFELEFLDALGLRPSLSACASCGRDLPDRMTQRVTFHPGAGGVQCSACRRASRVDLMPAEVNAENAGWQRPTIATLRDLERLRRDELPLDRELPGDRDRLRIARDLLDDFVAWHLERPSRVRPYLR